MDAPEKDWRYDNIHHLRGLAFEYRPWSSPSQDWDHDHCNGCWAKFADFNRPEILHAGYVTRRPDLLEPESEFIQGVRGAGCRVTRQPTVDGFTLHWVCPKCFEDFKEHLGFRLA